MSLRFRHIVVKSINRRISTTASRLAASDEKIVLTGNPRVDSILDKSKNKLFEVMSIYEEAIGLKEIKEAQDQVLEAEKQFVVAQQNRRDLNLKLTEIQEKLRNTREEMERFNRTDSRYLQLFTEEHNTLKAEVQLVNEYKLKESEERELFFFLSAALRNAQEKERARVERIKYLQLGLSVLCTSLGILSAYLFNYFRNANIREILEFERAQFGILNEKISQLDLNQKNVITNLNQIEGSSVSAAKSIDKLISDVQSIDKSPKHLSDNQAEIINKEPESYFYLNPYVLSGLFLVSFIFFTNK